MGKNVPVIFLGIGDLKANAVGAHDAGIANLTAGFTVEWRLIENDNAGVAFFERTDFFAIAQDCRDDSLGALGLVAEKFCGPEFFAQNKPNRAGRRFAGARP